MDTSSYNHRNSYRTYTIIWLVSLVVFFLMLRGCGGEPMSETTTKTDTIYVPKIIKIPAIVGTAEVTKPKEKEVGSVNTELKRKYQELQTENERLQEYERLATTREYENSFQSDSGEVEITINSNVTGVLDSQKVSFKVKEREVKYEERVITNTTTEKLKQKFAISGGLSAQTSLDPTNLKPNVGATIGFRNKSGYTLDLNANTNRDVMVTIKKDIFVFWR